MISKFRTDYLPFIQMKDYNADLATILTQFSKKLFRLLENLITTLAINLKLKKCGGTTV